MVVVPTAKVVHHVATGTEMVRDQPIPRMRWIFTSIMGAYVNVNMTRRYSHNRFYPCHPSGVTTSSEKQTQVSQQNQGLIRHVELVRLEWDRRQQQLER